MAGIDEFRRMASTVSNWGRWGTDDELGTLNFIDSEKVRAAAALVRLGKVFPLGVNFDAHGPQGALGFRWNPVHLMTLDGGDGPAFVQHMADWSANPTAQAVAGMFQNLLKFNDDYIIMPLQAATQWDALSHVYYDEQLYNGFAASTVTSFGARYLGIDKVDVKGITSRGVLLDACAHRGLGHLADGPPIGPEELDEMCRAQRVEIARGDIVCVRTGWWGMLRAGGTSMTPTPGLSWRCAEWLRDNEVAAVAADNMTVEGVESEVDGVMLPMHLLCLRDMGLMFGEMWNFDALAADCAEDGVWEFQLVAPPLRVTGAVGTPLNPIAMK